MVDEVRYQRLESNWVAQDWEDVQKYDPLRTRL
jgi:hypothetical protein